MQLINQVPLSFSIIVILSIVIACTRKTSTQKEPTIQGRWFTRQQYELGKQIFVSHCARCHGIRAEGIVSDWRQRNPDGTFPPPPLDGSAHAWHHPFEVLLRQINEGGIKLGGSMPAFGDSLTNEEAIAAIAYFQSYWDEQIYNRWLQMNAEQ